MLASRAAFAKREEREERESNAQSMAADGATLGSVDARVCLDTPSPSLSEISMMLPVLLVLSTLTDTLSP
jgi:hypothetical protein